MFRYSPFNRDSNAVYVTHVDCTCEEEICKCHEQWNPISSVYLIRRTMTMKIEPSQDEEWKPYEEIEPEPHIRKAPIYGELRVPKWIKEAIDRGENIFC